MCHEVCGALNLNFMIRYSLNEQSKILNFERLEEINHVIVGVGKNSRDAAYHTNLFNVIMRK
jgi:hypothetical protein